VSGNEDLGERERGQEENPESGTQTGRVGHCAKVTGAFARTRKGGVSESLGGGNKEGGEGRPGCKGKRLGNLFGFRRGDSTEGLSRCKTKKGITNRWGETSLGGGKWASGVMV